MFSEPLLTTSTRVLKFNISFNDRELIKKLEPNEIIPRISSNFGDMRHSSYREIQKRKYKSKKQKIKKHSRYFQGSGTHFNNEITFHCINPFGTYYKIKLFCNGGLQCTGVTDGNDFMNKVIAVKKMVENSLGISDIVISNYRTIIRNYKFQYLKDNLLILFKLFKTIQKLNDEKISKAHLRYNPERSSALIFKLLDGSTVLTYCSGKINIILSESGDIEVVINLLKKIFNKYN